MKHSRHSVRKFSFCPNLKYNCLLSLRFPSKGACCSSLAGLQGSLDVVVEVKYDNRVFWAAFFLSSSNICIGAGRGCGDGQGSFPLSPYFLGPLQFIIIKIRVFIKSTNVFIVCNLSVLSHHQERNTLCYCLRVSKDAGIYGSISPINGPHFGHP